MGIMRQFFDGNRLVVERYTAAANPAVTDDVRSNFDVGSVWINTTTADTFICMSPAYGAAVWEEAEDATTVLAAAALDATTKANTAQSTAISTASGDATTKANAAQAAAIATAAGDATTKANAAQAAAAGDATTKANAAQAAAEATASWDATSKANAAQAAAAGDATTKANAAQAAAESTASGDATSKANAAQAAAISGASPRTNMVVTAGAAVPAVGLGLGLDATEGYQLMVIDETLNLTALGAKFKALTTAVPSGAVILSAQANIEAAVTAGGTTALVALGLNGGDVDKYGISTALTKNNKINTIPAHAVLSGTEQIDVCGVVVGGATLGDTNISAGSVRVRVVYAIPTSLKNAV